MPTTNGQRLLAKVQSDLEWAVRMFNESAAPEAVDIKGLVSEIHHALVARRLERLDAAPEVKRETGD